VPLETATVGVPERFDIQDRGGTLRIEWKWPRIAALPLAIFTVTWDGFLFSWYSNLLTHGNAPSAMFLFPIAHVAVGLVLPYMALACFVNYTFVEVGEGRSGSVIGRFHFRQANPQRFRYPSALLRGTDRAQGRRDLRRHGAARVRERNPDRLRSFDRPRSAFPRAAH
jgi:hypothetical protein